MNQTKIQYALIAHREILEAKRRMDQWQNHFMERLASLDDDEVGEFKKSGGVIGAGSPHSQGRAGISKPGVFGSKIRLHPFWFPPTREPGRGMRG